MGNFDGLEAYGPFHPEAAVVRRVGMAEELPLFVLYDLRLPSSRPPVVDVPIALVVGGGHFQGDGIFLVRI